ncbi:MAG: hypothetical protein RJB39_473 [Candidatus Parcubacteria bacterium]|jgi:hypothetical protein
MKYISLFVCLFFALFNTACTVVRDDDHYPQDGVYQRSSVESYGGGSTSSTRTTDTSNQPIGLVKTTHTPYTITGTGNAHLHIRGDAPKEVVTAVQKKVGAATQAAYDSTGNYWTREQVEARCSELFEAKGYPLTLTTEEHKRYCFKVEKYATEIQTGAKVLGTPEIKENHIYKDGEIPTNAKRNPATPAPSSLQPQGGRRPADTTPQPRRSTGPSYNVNTTPTEPLLPE